MDIPIEIRLKPHLVKFLKSNTNKAGVIPLSITKFPGYVLIPLLEKNMSHHNERYENIKGEVVKFTINEFDFNRFGANISPIKEHIFNEQLDDMFREQLFKAVELAIISVPYTRQPRKVKHQVMQQYYKRKVEVVTKPPEIRSCIIKFCQLHGITEEDISIDTLKKDHYRWRTRDNKRSKLFM
jgi:hypothetical protein